MFGFSEKCPVCGMKVKKGKGVKRFGKIFCSEVHEKSERFFGMPKSSAFRASARGNMKSGGNQHKNSSFGFPVCLIIYFRTKTLTSS